MAHPPVLSTAVLAWALFAAPPSGAGEQAPISTLVVPIDARTGVASDEAELLTMALMDAVRQHGTANVVALRDMEQAMTQEMRKQALNCSTTDCALEIAGTLNAQELIVGALGRIGSRMVLGLSRIDARNGTTLATSVRRIKGNDAGRFLAKLPEMVEELMGPQEDPESLAEATEEPEEAAKELAEELAAAVPAAQEAPAEEPPPEDELSEAAAPEEGMRGQLRRIAGRVTTGAGAGTAGCAALLCAGACGSVVVANVGYYGAGSVLLNSRSGTLSEEEQAVLAVWFAFWMLQSVVLAVVSVGALLLSGVMGAAGLLLWWL